MGTSFGNNSLYLLWADVNGSEGGTTGELAFVMDDMTFTPTYGANIAPGGENWGSRVDWGVENFEPTSSLAIDRLGGEIIEKTTPLGMVNHALHLSNRTLSVLTEQIDLRGPFSGPQISIDLRVSETSDGTDFEPEDFIEVIAEYSQTGHTFLPITMAHITGGSGVGDLNDQLKRLELEPAGPDGLLRFGVVLPQDALTVRLRINARNDSVTEHFYFDNIGVEPYLEPEPHRDGWARANCSGLFRAAKGFS